MSRRGPNFSTRTAQEDVARLDPSESEAAAPSERGRLLSWPPTLWSRSPGTSTAELSNGADRSIPWNPLQNMFEWWSKKPTVEREQQNDGDAGNVTFSGPLRDNSADRKDKPAHRHRSPEESKKLGTFSGVFVPTSLNVLSILMFLRFGFILGQAGLLGMLGLLVISYLINLVTTMSLSAIATNGTVRGGGAYYLISRSLGPEFGGSIGVVFYLGLVFNTGMNAVGLIDCFTQNFGTQSGTLGHFLKEGFWWQYLWGTVVLVLCTGICLAGSSIFARASNGLLVLLLIATFSIPLSAVFLKPFTSPLDHIEFTGLSWRTLQENLMPRFTKGAAGSQLKGRENFQDLFGILYPATGGIFAGASMSGDLRNPSKSIPKGTLAGLALTFISYVLVIVTMAASIRRQSLYNNTNVIQIVNYSDTVILIGEFATSFFSALMGVIGSAKLLQAIARDSLLPGINVFGRGSKKTDEPINAIIITFVFAQLTMLFDINQIASFVTMTYLMTFLVTNLACFLLKIGSAPNFRPSFHYFNWHTAALGTLVSGISMFFVDGLYATGCVGILLMLFLLIHYSSPPKAWGDVSQSLIYHQVRKYLLRLKQEHVKFWRPQILLFVSDLDRQYKMVSFCNSLKKGALFVLGHVLVTDDFSSAVPEARRQQSVWTKLVEFSKIKAFVNVAISPAAEWGIRNVVLNSGLGGMRPNIVVIDQFREDQSLVETLSSGTTRRESLKSRRRSSLGNSHDETYCESDSQSKGMSSQSYVTILEDLLFNLRINVAVAKGFEDLELPGSHDGFSKKFIDLWPIQMSAEIAGLHSEHRPFMEKSLQAAGAGAVFVEYETDVDDERGRVEALLEKLRAIEAEVLVFWLACGDIHTYRVIVNGDTSPEMALARDSVHSVLKDEEWWQGLLGARNAPRHLPERSEDGEEVPRLDRTLTWQGPASVESENKYLKQRVKGLRELIQRRRHSESSDDSDLEPYVSDSEVDEADDEREDGDSSEGGDASSPERSRTTPRERSERLDRSSGSPGGSPGSSPFTRPPVRSSVTSNVVPTSDQLVPSLVTSSDSSSKQPTAPGARPAVSRSASSKRFSSAPIPEAKVVTEEGAGPSIMFAASASPPRFTQKLDSIYARRASPVSSGPAVAQSNATASGFPGPASVSLSFNDLPSRAQHLILNELMRQHSEQTAVIFTTLPTPSHGTSQSDDESASYLSDLEVLWQGLPPCLLVHSNSMTVTMNL
ncbi:Vacuolar cation-chloride cotransporter 1 [Penicillium oxalicum]|uniref:Vacuolar cation-chloride cotransporter 1 n=1 Tax=Penicillium oxalicum TaxID=69781 RepID=UPI0020B641D8|nr:Vacuolar cation-chloride cotransporter 1 [Penicillium oxalicum]KAI2792266.1 Vacuolar cation-chloride cotransporter 1 [Penicillium oxalicum]